MRRFLFIASICLAALLALLITATNPVRVDIELAFGRLVSPLGITLVIAFTLGLLCGLAARVYWVAELLNERGRLRRALRIAEAGARSNAAAGDRGE